MAWKKHTDIGAGVIDADYRGEARESAGAI